MSNLEDSHEKPGENTTGLSATNSQIGAAAQITGSPNPVVTQIIHTNDPGLAGVMVGVFGALLLLGVAGLSLAVKAIPASVTTVLLGIGIALLVAGFFGWVEGLLKSETRTEIADWLADPRMEDRFARWQKTFPTLFDRVFGHRHLSFVSFGRSILATTAVLAVTSALFYFVSPQDIYFRELWVAVSGQNWQITALYVAWAVVGYYIPDYFSLLKTRWLLRGVGDRNTVGIWLILAGDGILGLWIGYSTVALGTALLLEVALYAGVDELPKQFVVDAWWVLVHPFGYGDRFDLTVFRIPLFYSAFSTSIWLWLYTTSGYILKFAKRFDVFFGWLNKHLDIERKPLQTVGLVAGSVVASAYWGVAVGRWLIARNS